MARIASAAFICMPINKQDSTPQNWRRNEKAVICSSTNYKAVHAQVLILGRFARVVDDVPQSLSNPSQTVPDLEVFTP